MKSLKLKVLLSSIAVFFLVLLSCFVVLFQLYSEEQRGNFDINLYNHAVDIGHSIDVNMLGDVVVHPTNQIANEGKIIPFSLGLSMIQLRRMDGQVILSSPRQLAPLPFPEDAVPRTRSGQSIFLDFTHRNQRFRAVILPLVRTPFETLFLEVAASTHTLDQGRRQIVIYFALILVVSLFALGFVTWRALKKSFLSVREIMDSASSLKPAALSEGLPLPEDEELRELTVTINQLLVRTEKALKSQEQFSADASHQLKTPIAILKAEVDVFKSKPRSEEDTRLLMDSLSQGLSDLSQLIENLLLMAKFDSGAARPQMKTVRLDEVVLQVLSQLQPLASRAGVELFFEIAGSTQGEDLEILADESLLLILFFNLIENAIKHSMPGGRVEVFGGADSKGAVVRICDRGIGIPASEIPLIFDRFHRAENVSSEKTGAGLGLAIVKRISDLLGGQLRVESQVGEGSVFTWEIKKS